VSDRRTLILGTIQDLVGSLLYYDRKNDDDLDRDAIPAAVAAGEISVDEMADEFRAELKRRLPAPSDHKRSAE
jgi:hypothetical protein